MHAATCLPAITGAWQYEGGGAMYVNGDIYKFDMSLIEGHAMRDESIRALDQSRIGAVLTGDAEALYGGPPVTAMLIQNTNPMMVAPDLNVVHRGFLRDDLFTCVHEQFMTETAQVADIVLPATTFLEHDDIYKGGGHQHIMMGPKVIEPPGEARENHFVFRELARRLGIASPDFEMSAWEMIDETLKRSGYPGAAELTEMRWLDCQPPFEEAHFLSGFGHADGRFHFAPDWAAIGPAHAVMPRLPDHLNIIEVATPEHPFRMVTAPAPQLPEFQLHRDADRHPQGKAADGDGASRRCRTARGGRGREGRARQCPGGGGSACRTVRRRAAGRADRREHLAQPRLRGRHRHQRPDRRRCGAAEWRRRLPRHRGLAAPAQLSPRRSLRPVAAAALLAGTLLALAAAAAQAAAGTLETARARGVLACGIHKALAGFADADAQGRLQGLDVDLCRAVAAAVLGDAGKVAFVPVNAQQRFSVLQSGEVDLLVHTTTWTLVRDTRAGAELRRHQLL